MNPTGFMGRKVTVVTSGLKFVGLIVGPAQIPATLLPTELPNVLISVQVKVVLNSSVSYEVDVDQIFTVPAFQIVSEDIFHHDEPDHEIHHSDTEHHAW